FGSMDRFTDDRASSDETYNAMSDPTPEFIHSLLGKDATGSPQTRRFNFILLIDASGRISASRGLDLVTNQVIDIPDALKAHVSVTDPLFQSAVSKGKINGVLLLPDGPLLVVVHPIITSRTKSPIRGFVLSARYLDSGGDLRGLERTTNFSLSNHKVDEDNLPDDFLNARRHLSKQGDIYVRSINDSVLGGYAFIFDVYGKPALILKVEMPRGIYRQGQVSQLYFVGSLGIAGLVFAIAVMLLLEKSVVSRLSALSTSVTAIASSGDASAQVHCPGSDELSHLGSAINRMLESLQQSQRQRQQTEQRYRAFMNNIPAIAMIKDAEGRIVYVNEPMARNYNLNIHAVLGKPTGTWIPEELSKKIRIQDQEVIRTQRVMQFEQVIPPPDGVLHHRLSYKFPLD